MDLASLVLRWIDDTRGLLTMAVIDVVHQHPFNVHHSTECLRAVFSPFAGHNRVDFWFVRPLRWYVPDLYKKVSESIYWYTAGLNWRAFFAWTISIAFLSTRACSCHFGVPTWCWLDSGIPSHLVCWYVVSLPCWHVNKSKLHW